MTESTSQWLTRNTRVAAVDFSVYNPAINAFAAVQVTTAFLRDGGVKTSVAVIAFPLFTTRFQPSIPFQIVMAVIVIVLSSVLVRRALCLLMS